MAGLLEEPQRANSKMTSTAVSRDPVNMLGREQASVVNELSKLGEEREEKF